MTVIGFSNQEEWGKEHEVVSICRADLSHIGLSVSEVDSLTDADMQDIASRMADIYFDNGYWDDLQEAVAYVFAQRGDQDERTSEPDEPTDLRRA